MSVVLDLDVHDPVLRPWLGSPVLCDWMRELGVDPRAVYRLAVLADGDGQVEFHRYATCDGKRYRDPGTDDVALLPVTTVPLTVPIPTELLAYRTR